MKNNIDTGKTLNRKIVVELRFQPIPKILDLRGTIIEKIDNLKLFDVSNWELGDTNISVKDSLDDDYTRNRILIDLNRLLFISTKIDSIESFYSKFQKIYDAFTSLIEIKEINRIGCRIQGTYKVKSDNFDLIFTNFKNSFPSQIFLEDFPAKDLMFRLDYQNGMYNIGPVNIDDKFLKNEFKFIDKANKVGIAIDTDNFLFKTKGSSLNQSKIKDVLTASLAVEKSLYEKMKDF